jgi:hypothetical protein
MTHGLNVLVVNVVVRRPIGAADGAVAFVGRGGVGPTLPHAESTVGGRAREQYEYAGLAADGAAGLDLRLRGPLSAVIEYKFTAARPEISIVGGTGRMTAITHQVAFGLALGMAR